MKYFIFNEFFEQPHKNQFNNQNYILLQSIYFFKLLKKNRIWIHYTYTQIELISLSSFYLLY